MPLVADPDIQVFLPKDKFDILAADLPDDITKVKLDVERVIRGRLSGVFSPATLAVWADPTTTPEYIRAIGGRIGAALLYSLRLAEDWPEEADWARKLYAEGMQMLEMVAMGEVTLPEVTEVVDTGSHLTVNNFAVLPAPKFSMESEF